VSLGRRRASNAAGISYQLPDDPPPLLEPPDELRLLELELELLPDELLPSRSSRPLLLPEPPVKKPNSIASPNAMPVGIQDSQSVRSRSGGF
jgi:hypothetical protein